MPATREVNALHFVKKNETFFRGPIDNHNQFIKFYERQNKIEQIADYVQKFITVLQTTIHKEITFEAPATFWWQKGEFEQVLSEPAIHQFITDNYDHPALVVWQEEHPPKDIPALAHSENELFNLQDSLDHDYQLAA
jgi:hypothetical protein